MLPVLGLAWGIWLVKRSLQDENSINHQGGNVASCSSCWTLERTGMVRDVAAKCFHYPYLLSISVC